MIEQIAIGILWTWGIYCAFQNKYLLGKLGKAIEQIVGSVVVKPLFACPPCMGGFYGLLFSLYFQNNLIETIIYITCLIGANFIIKEYLYDEPV